MVLGAVKQACHDYYQSLPNNILRVPALSALLSGTVSLLFAQNKEGVVDLTRPLIKSGIAALASLVYGLVTPFFRFVFEYQPNQNPTWGSPVKEFIKSSTVVLLTSLAIDFALTSRVNFTALKLASLASFNTLGAYVAFQSNDQHLQHFVDTNSSVYFSF